MKQVSVFISSAVLLLLTLWWCADARGRERPQGTPDRTKGAPTTGGEADPVGAETRNIAAEEKKEEEKKEGEEKTASSREKVYHLKDLMVIATRTPRLILETPRSLSMVDSERLQELNPLVPIDALRYEPGVWLEHRTTSTADPILRGFAGANILALVDGNTLSTLWGEGGEGADDMYGKIDPDWIERIEVIRGPASVMYGSNAIGGVINLITRKPALDFTEAGMAARVRTKGTYASAAREYRLRTEFHGATPFLRFMLGGSLQHLDDVEGGRGEGTLVPSDSAAGNWDFSSEFIPFGKDHTFRLTYQNTNLNGTKRYYKPHETNFLNRDALSLAYVNTVDNMLWDRLETRFYYQYKQDRRVWISGPDAGLHGIQKLKTYTGDVQVTRILGENHRLSYGIHYESDDGESPGDEQLTFTGPGYAQKVKNTPDSVWQNFGLFAQDEWDLTDRLTLIAGARYDAFDFRSNPDQYYVPPLAGQDPQIDQINERTGEFSGGLGVDYRVTETTAIYGNYARGFRLNPPNFGIWLVHGSYYRVPNGFLDPMIADQFETGVKTKGEGYSATAAAYYTLVNDNQREVPTTYNGSDFYDSNGNGIQEPDLGEYPYLEVVGGGKAVVGGFECSADARIDTLCGWLGAPGTVDPGWSVRGGFAYERGHDREVHKPLQFTHPTYGFTALRYDLMNEEHPAWVEFAGTFVGRYTRVFDEGGREWLADPQDPDSGLLRDYVGTPGYTVLDLRGGVELWKNAALTLAVENLTDKRYRAAHSRMDAPGINFVVSLDIWF